MLHVGAWHTTELQLKVSWPRARPRQDWAWVCWRHREKYVYIGIGEQQTKIPFHPLPTRTLGVFWTPLLTQWSENRFPSVLGPEAWGQIPASVHIVNWKEVGRPPCPTLSQTLSGPSVLLCVLGDCTDARGLLLIKCLSLSSWYNRALLCLRSTSQQGGFFCSLPPWPLFPSSLDMVSCVACRDLE